MKKFLNNPEDFVDEMLEGIYLAHPEVTHVGDDLRCFVRTNPVPGKVGLVTGGGSGHLPLFLGISWARTCWTARAWAACFSRRHPSRCWT